jgi:hypothetical protein
MVTIVPLSHKDTKRHEEMKKTNLKNHQSMEFIFKRK